MTDLDDLIAEAEEFDRHPCDPQENYLIHRLADALEAVTSERDAALEAIERVRAIIKTHVGYQLARAEKFGRYTSDCACEMCQIHAALDGAPEPDNDSGYEYVCTGKEIQG